MFDKEGDCLDNPNHSFDSDSKYEKPSNKTAAPKFPKANKKSRFQIYSKDNLESALNDNPEEVLLE